MARLGIGQFAGNVDPQDPTGAVVRPLRDSFAGDPGLRLAGSRGRRVFFSAGLTPQVFVRQQGGTNSAAALEVAPLKRSRSRALGQMRGFPYMSMPGAGS